MKPRRFKVDPTSSTTGVLVRSGEETTHTGRSRVRMQADWSDVALSQKASGPSRAPQKLGGRGSGIDSTSAPRRNLS